MTSKSNVSAMKSRCISLVMHKSHLDTDFVGCWLAQKIGSGQSGVKWAHVTMVFSTGHHSALSMRCERTSFQIVWKLDYLCNLQRNTSLVRPQWGSIAWPGQDHIVLPFKELLMMGFFCILRFKYQDVPSTR